MAFAMPLAMAMTAIGAGIGAYGKYQAGQAQAAAYGAQATFAQQQATALGQVADLTTYAGARAGEATGLQYRAELGRQNVAYGAQNIGGASPQRVGQSIVGLGNLAQAEMRGKYEDVAYQERFTAAEKTAAAGIYGAAARQAPVAGAIGAAGDIVGGIGSTAGMGVKAGQFTPSAPSQTTAGAPLSILGDASTAPVNPLKWPQQADLGTSSGPWSG